MWGEHLKWQYFREYFLTIPKTWPAFWTTAETNWPSLGEIDIIEGDTTTSHRRAKTEHILRCKRCSSESCHTSHHIRMHHERCEHATVRVSRTRRTDHWHRLTSSAPQHATNDGLQLASQRQLGMRCFYQQGELVWPGFQFERRRLLRDGTHIVDHQGLVLGPQRIWHPFRHHQWCRQRQSRELGASCRFVRKQQLSDQPEVWRRKYYYQSNTL